MSLQNEKIICSGFCADPIELRMTAMQLMALSNSLKCNQNFINTQTESFLDNDCISNGVNLTELWETDVGEQIVTKATTLAIGCRRLLQDFEEDFDIPCIGSIIEKSKKGHDNKSNSMELSLCAICSRLVHSTEWSIDFSSDCENAQLLIGTDSQGKYSVCLSSFALACWLLTKPIEHSNGETTIVLPPPNLKKK